MCENCFVKSQIIAHLGDVYIILEITFIFIPNTLSTEQFIWNVKKSKGILLKLVCLQVGKKKAKLKEKCQPKERSLESFSCENKKLKDFL